MFQRLLTRSGSQARIRRLYGAIVAQARAPGFYADFGVPDTVEGRFDMVLLHVYLVWRRLAKEGASTRETAQEMFDLFVQDMDESMREMGVGDLSVPKKVRAMGEAYYGRAGAYDAALGETGDDNLVAALSRNVFGGAPGMEAQSVALGKYVRAADRSLSAQDAEKVARGDVVFPALEEVR